MKPAYQKATVKITLFDNSDVVTTSDFTGSMENTQTGSCPGNGSWIKEQKPCRGKGGDVGYHCPHSFSDSKEHGKK